MDTKQPGKIKPITTNTVPWHNGYFSHTCYWSLLFLTCVCLQFDCPSGFAMQIFRSWLIIWAQSKGEVVWRVSSIQSTCLGTWRSYQKGSLSLWGSGGSSGACVDGTGNTAGWETALAYLSDLSMLCSLSYPTCGTNSQSFVPQRPYHSVWYSLHSKHSSPPLSTCWPLLSTQH